MQQSGLCHRPQQAHAGRGGDRAPGRHACDGGGEAGCRVAHAFRQKAHRPGQRQRRRSPDRRRIEQVLPREPAGLLADVEDMEARAHQPRHRGCGIDAVARAMGHGPFVGIAVRADRQRQCRDHERGHHRLVVKRAAIMLDGAVRQHRGRDQPGRSVHSPGRPDGGAGIDRRGGRRRSRRDCRRPAGRAPPGGRQGREPQERGAGNGKGGGIAGHRPSLRRPANRTACSRFNPKPSRGCGGAEIWHRRAVEQYALPGPALCVSSRRPATRWRGFAWRSPSARSPIPARWPS